MRVRTRLTAAASLLSAALLLVGCGSTYTPPRGPRPTRAPSPVMIGDRPASTCSDSLQSYAPASATISGLDSDKMVVGVNTDAPPLAWQSQTGAFQGFEVDLATAVVDHLYGEPGHLRLVPIDDDSLPEDFSNGVDLIIGQVPLTCGNWDRATLSASYLTTSNTLLARVSDPTELKAPTLESLPYPNERICTNTGTGQRQLAGARGAASVSQCLVWLQQGEIDLIVTESARATGLLQQDRTLRRLADLPEPVNYGVAAGKDRTELQAGVNEALSQWIASGRWQASHDRWLREDLGDGRPPQPSYGRNP